MSLFLSPLFLGLPCSWKSIYCGWSLNWSAALFFVIAVCRIFLDTLTRKFLELDVCADIKCDRCFYTVLSGNKQKTTSHLITHADVICRQSCCCCRCQQTIKPPSTTQSDPTTVLVWTDQRSKSDPKKSKWDHVVFVFCLFDWLLCFILVQVLQAYHGFCRYFRSCPETSVPNQLRKCSAWTAYKHHEECRSPFC